MNTSATGRWLRGIRWATTADNSPGHPYTLTIWQPDRSPPSQPSWPTLDPWACRPLRGWEGHGGPTPTGVYTYAHPLSRRPPWATIAHPTGILVREVPTVRQLEFYDHQHDSGPGQSSPDSRVTLSDDGVLTPAPLVADIVEGQRRRLARYLGRPPSETELFEHLASWSNGYLGGRELHNG